MVESFGNNIIGAFTGGTSVNAIYSYGVKVWSIFIGSFDYTSTDNQIVVPYRDGRGGTGDDYTNGFGARIVFNTYSTNGGKLGFDDIVTKVDFGFTNCITLKTINLPDTVTNIGISAFDGCNSLISIDIPDSVTNIGWLAFFGCSSLTSIEIPSSVTNIGDAVFRNCVSLSTVIVNSTTPPTLGTGVFRNTATNLLIKVPAASLQAYRTATGWSDYASSIVSQ